MRLANETQKWGNHMVVIHWLTALSVFFLFGLGYWMTGLTYYDEWYRTGPFIHKSVGIILLALTLGRLVLRFKQRAPQENPQHKTWEHRLAKIVHVGIYVLLLTILISGYLISTADGRGISVFDWFTVPATLSGIDGQEDIAGAIHWYGAWALMGVVGLHVAGAVKHPLIDKDSTIKRILFSFKSTQ